MACHPELVEGSRAEAFAHMLRQANMTCLFIQGYRLCMLATTHPAGPPFADGDPLFGCAGKRVKN
jgi:hypothetical protein